MFCIFIHYNDSLLTQRAPNGPQLLFLHCHCESHQLVRTCVKIENWEEYHFLSREMNIHLSFSYKMRLHKRITLARKWNASYLRPSLCQCSSKTIQFARSPFLQSPSQLFGYSVSQLFFSCFEVADKFVLLWPAQKPDTCRCLLILHFLTAMTTSKATKTRHWPNLCKSVLTAPPASHFPGLWARRGICGNHVHWPAQVLLMLVVTFMGRFCNLRFRRHY